jgi:hypothetical protein
MSRKLTLNEYDANDLLATVAQLDAMCEFLDEQAKDLVAQIGSLQNEIDGLREQVVQVDEP